MRLCLVFWVSRPLFLYLLCNTNFHAGKGTQTPLSPSLPQRKTDSGPTQTCHRLCREWTRWGVGVRSASRIPTRAQGLTYWHVTSL